MNNRRRIEKEMRIAYPEAEITHAVGMPFTVSISADGQRSKRALGLPMFCCPSCIGCGDAKQFTKPEYIKTNAGAPGTSAMTR